MTAYVLPDNRIQEADAAVHGWYRFVLSFPPHLVRSYLERFAVSSAATVLDPFCGTGTTLVECKKLGIASEGLEANPMAHFASQVKLDWTVSPDALRAYARATAEEAYGRLEGCGGATLPLLAPRRTVKPEELRRLPAGQHALLLANSISPVPLHKSLVLRDLIVGSEPIELHGHALLALARTLVETAGNLHFGPEVGVRGRKSDAPVVESWLANTEAIAADLEWVAGRAGTPSHVHRRDARGVAELVPPRCVDFVFTSPPYPNEKDYTRTTRLESVILGFLQSKEDLRRLKRSLLRSNTRNVYRDDRDHLEVADNPAIQALADELETRRKSLGKTSGFERLYARVTRLYFGGMKRHLAELRGCLRPGAHLCYVVGDPASYLQVMIRTGQLLAEIAESLGYEVVGIDLFRKRIATATREWLREEVVLLRWKGEVS
ncbi:DNA methyltransferase [bacterium]|nr:DNA methyltransferase [bacterium]